MTSEYLSFPKGRSKSLLLFFSGTGPPYHAEKSEIKQGDSPHKNNNFGKDEKYELQNRQKLL